MVNWDDLRIFLAVARKGRLGQAARELGLDATTVGRRLGRLTAALDSELFEQTGDGYRLTEQGARLLSYAEHIESAAMRAEGEIAGGGSRLAGHVRISLSEGLATWILAPQLPTFNAEHPLIGLDFITASGFLNPSRREADIAIMLARPRRGPLVTRKLCDYTLKLYGSRRYVAAAPPIRSVDDLARHPLVAYVPEFIFSPELDYLSEVGDGLTPSLRSTSINIQHRMIAAGAGVGVLPRFMGSKDETLVELLPDAVSIKRAFWLVVHRDIRPLARIDAAIGWIEQSMEGIS